jgi:hypothetical protein
MAAARQFSGVVLPACVPPDTKTLSPLRTEASRNRGGWSDAAERDQVVQMRSAYHELSNVHRPKSPGDIRDRYMQAVPQSTRARRLEVPFPILAVILNSTSGSWSTDCRHAAMFLRGWSGRGTRSPAGAWSSSRALPIRLQFNIYADNDSV